MKYNNNNQALIVTIILRTAKQCNEICHIILYILLYNNNKKIMLMVDLNKLHGEFLRKYNMHNLHKYTYIIKRTAVDC